MRLSSGELDPRDVNLLDHEQAELIFMAEHPEATQAQAHDHAQSIHDWGFRHRPSDYNQHLDQWRHRHGHPDPVPQDPADPRNTTPSNPPTGPAKAEDPPPPPPPGDGPSPSGDGPDDHNPRPIVTEAEFFERMRSEANTTGWEEEEEWCLCLPDLPCTCRLPKLPTDPPAPQPIPPKDDGPPWDQLGLPSDQLGPTHLDECPPNPIPSLPPVPPVRPHR